MSQSVKLLELLRQRGERGITPMEALELLGSLRLAARIKDVEHFLADDEVIVNVGHRTESGKAVARYVIRHKATPAKPVQESLW